MYLWRFSCICLGRLHFRLVLYGLLTSWNSFSYSACMCIPHSVLQKSTNSPLPLLHSPNEKRLVAARDCDRHHEQPLFSPGYDVQFREDREYTAAICVSGTLEDVTVVSVQVNFGWSEGSRLFFIWSKLLAGCICSSFQLVFLAFIFLVEILRNIVSSKFIVRSNTWPYLEQHLRLSFCWDSLKLGKKCALLSSMASKCCNWHPCSSQWKPVQLRFERIGSVSIYHFASSYWSVIISAIYSDLDNFCLSIQRELHEITAVRPISYCNIASFNLSLLCSTLLLNRPPSYLEHGISPSHLVTGVPLKIWQRIIPTNTGQQTTTAIILRMDC